MKFTLPIDDLQKISDNIRELWPRNKNFLITGATGFIGRWLVESISFLETELKSNNKYFLLSRKSKAENQKKIPCLSENYFFIIESDISTFKVTKEEIHFVIHGATSVTDAKNSAGVIESFNSTVLGTANLLNQLKLKNVEKILYISSGAVYGAHDSPVKEDDVSTLKTESIKAGYGVAKHAAEWMSFAFGNTFGVAINSARCFSFVGPFVDSKMAVMAFLNAKVQNERVSVLSPGTTRSYMYPTDLITALFVILFKGKHGHSYNVGAGDPVTMAELARMIFSNEVNAADEEAPQQSLSGHFYVPVTKKIETDLGFSQQIALQTALSKTLNFLKNGNN